MRKAIQYYRDPGFSEGGSESGVDIGGGANPIIVSMKQGSGGAAIQKHWRKKLLKVWGATLKNSRFSIAKIEFLWSLKI